MGLASSRASNRMKRMYFIVVPILFLVVSCAGGVEPAAEKNLMGNEDLPGNWENDVEKRAPMRFGKRDLTEEMDEMKYLRPARAPMRFGKRVYQFTKKAPMRFGKRAPMRFGKRDIGETGGDDGLYD